MKIEVDVREFIEKRKTGISQHLENLLTPLVDGAGSDFALFVKRMNLIPGNFRTPSVKIVELPALDVLSLAAIYALEFQNHPERLIAWRTAVERWHGGH